MEMNYVEMLLALTYFHNKSSLFIAQLHGRPIIHVDNRQI